MSKPADTRKNYWIPVFVLALALAGGIVWAVARWSDSGPWVAPPEVRNLADPIQPSPAELTAAKQLYLDRCARCHGDQGKGDGPDAGMYKTPPGVLSNPDTVGRETDGELFWKIQEGRRPMPGFKKELTPNQCWELVNFIRTLTKSSAGS